MSNTPNFLDISSHSPFLSPPDNHGSTLSDSFVFSVLHKRNHRIHVWILLHLVLLMSMFLRFMHGVAKAVLSSFLLPNIMPLYRYTTLYPFTSWWAFRLFPLFGYYEQYCSECSRASLCVEHTFILFTFTGKEPNQDLLTFELSNFPQKIVFVEILKFI